MGRIYIVEDEALVAMLVEDMLVELGHVVVGVGARLDDALSAATHIECDLAILDINLNGQLSFPVAHTLTDRGIPFFFASGYGAVGVHEPFKSSMVLNKPFSMKQLEHMLQQQLG